MMGERRIIPPSHKTMFYGFTNEYSVIPKEDVEKLIAHVSEKDSLNRDDSLSNLIKGHKPYIPNFLSDNPRVVEIYKNIYKRSQE